MDRKALIALIICGLIMILYYPFILPLLTPKTKDIGEEVLKEKTEDVSPAEEDGAAPVISSAPDTLPRQDIPLEDTIILENELLKTVWTNDGAALKSVQLKKFKGVDKKSVLELIKDSDTDYMPLAIDSVFQQEDFRNRRYHVIDRSLGKISFSTSLAEGINLIKTVSLPDENYHVNMDVIIENNSTNEVSLSYDIIASSMIAHEGEPSADMAAVAGIDVEKRNIKLVRTAPKGFPSKNESSGIVWAGSANKYFAMVLKPESENLVKSITLQAFDEQGIPTDEKAVLGDFMVNIHTNKLRVPPGETIRHNYLFFAGPKREDILRQYETMESILSYGWLHSISKILLSFLNTVHRAIPNYGVSIIILTIIIKAMLFPLTKKSQTSMFRMQQLQPMIEKLKVKYKNDKQKLGKEQVLLFKKYGVNPMSGCFPMLLQLPVFFALFRTLQLSFEMRQASFLFWINDLSKPDVLMYLPFSIPFLGNTLNILPILMTGASFAQMKLTPRAPAADPQAQAQQKMMSFMPIMFAFILYKMPSGLTLYWTTSTMLSIVESIMIRRSTKKLKLVSQH